MITKTIETGSGIAGFMRGAAPDAGSGVGHGHHLALDFSFLVVQLDELTVVVDPLQRHHVAPADLEAAPAPDADFGVDAEQVLRGPRPAVSG